MPGRWGCPTCGTVYGAALHAGCPRHPGTQLVEEEHLPKITVAGGPSNPDAEPGQPGHIPPDDEKPKGHGTIVRRTTGPDEDAAVVAVREPKSKTKADRSGEDGDSGDEEESSPGSKSQTSPEKQPSSPKTSDGDPPQPAPTTGSRSSSARTAGSTASTTAGGRRTTGGSEK